MTNREVQRTDGRGQRTKVKGPARLLAALAPILLAACGGDYSSAGGGTTPPPDTQSIENCDQLFTRRVQPRLDFCRNCHVPGGIADVTDGRLFMLSPDESSDFANLRASWENLGRNADGGSRILKMASGTDTRSHSGGTPWPVGSQPWVEMRAQLLGFDDPAACAIGTVEPPVEERALLGSARGGHAFDTFCEGQPDGTPLPPDPRSLVRPGVNDGKAVYMNAYWQTCRPGAYATTCGEHRAQVARGKTLVAGTGDVGAAHEFSGNEVDTQNAVDLATYQNLWQRWGLPARPDNFDELVAERYGMALSNEHNPYPHPGEDPNLTDGGSGQLPAAFTLLRYPDGAWSNKLGITCAVCHAGATGTPADGPGLGQIYGGNNLGDLAVMSRDLGGFQTAFSVVTLNKVRGTGNITNFQLFGILTITDPQATPFYNPLFWLAPSTGTEDPPQWWNVGHRPLKFYDGGLPTDATRIELSWYFPGAGMPLEPAQDWIIAHEQDSTAWLASQKSPAWPYPVDTELAERGAILFHSKNLWEPALANPVPPPPGGNGSCAGCHGAYAPRYVHDPAYLDTPALEGIAAHIVPNRVIGTDTRRVDGNSESISYSAQYNWFAYRGIPECGDQNWSALRGGRELGYLAQPLYGVWASPPYFHNGSVPNVWEVLQPADRVPIWRRVSKPARANQAGQVIMGYDTDLARAYDREKLGWRYEALACGVGTTPYLDCNPGDEWTDPVLQALLSLVYANGGVVWNIVHLPPFNDQDIEDRKVYNTAMYSQDNGGHEFTAVLTDDERRAIIEYLKTL